MTIEDLRDQTVLSALKVIRDKLDNLIELLEPETTPTNLLWDTHFQWLAPYFEYVGGKYNKKYFSYFRNNGYTHNAIIKVKQATQTIIGSEGVLCCPLPGDPIVGYNNIYSFHDDCVRDLVLYLINKFPAAKDDYFNVYDSAERENILSSLCKISEKDKKSIDFNLLNYPHFNRHALKTIFTKWKNNEYQ